MSYDLEKEEFKNKQDYSKKPCNDDHGLDDHGNENHEHDDTHKRKSCMIYPDNHNKEVWDLFMTVVLLVSCMVTPLEIAFEDDIHESLSGIQIFDWSMDILFLMDIVVIFSSA